MGYKRAEEILPIELIELIQQYVDGTNIYIPRKQEHKQAWGAGTSYRQELQHRNQLIYRAHLSGTAVPNGIGSFFFLKICEVVSAHSLLLKYKKKQKGGRFSMMTPVYFA
ncbi:MAG: CD3324 family protein [Clostridiales bacterium]|nr:CD3324 family protein [Clostridiales bacterium]MDY4111459.1 CD3324 family protein [Roseburia sp.]